MKPIVEHYGPWKSEAVTCKQCGWVGNGNELVQGELFTDLYEMDCPSCSEVLLIVSLPTWEEAEAHREEMSPLERELFEKRTSAFAKLEKARLRLLGQLPDIPGDGEITLEWDMNWDVQDALDRTNRIKYGEEIVWEEMALYESYERFAEIAKLLKQKYGVRLVDLVPTENSKTYLWGDRYSAPKFTDDMRRWLRSNNPKDLPLSHRNGN